MSAVYREVPVAEAMPEEGSVIAIIDGEATQLWYGEDSDWDAFRQEERRWKRWFSTEEDYNDFDNALAPEDIPSHWLQRIDDAVVLTREDAQEITRLLGFLLVGTPQDYEPISKALKLLEK